MQVRWNYKLQPNKSQQALMEEWLVTLRKHRNFSLAERIQAFETNNAKCDQPVCYQSGAYCDLDTKIGYGSYCPLTCPVVKHGVVSADLFKKSQDKKKKVDTTPVVVEAVEDGPCCLLTVCLLTCEWISPLKWRQVAEVQSAKTTELRSQNYWFGRVHSSVLQGNGAKLETAYQGFFKHKRGYPAFRKRSTFKTFQYKPGEATLDINRSSKKKRPKGLATALPSPLWAARRCYSHVDLPGIGRMRYLDSRTIPVDADQRTIVIKREADGWYMSVLLNLSEELPEVADFATVKSAVGIDMGINKLIALSDGFFIENPKFATNKKTKRLLKIRQRRVSRKVKGSINRGKAGKAVARMHKKIADRRDAYQWQAAHKVVNTAAAVVREDLKIKNMKARCKTNKVKGRFMPNGQSAKRGLNRAISDASWGSQFDKIEWVARKQGKPVVAVPAKFTSQECAKCKHISADNRDGEKFLCEECGHIDHADTQASRTVLGRAKLKFVSIRRKNLPGDYRKVTPVRYDSAANSKRDQDGNRISKAMPEKRILAEQLRLFG